MKTNIGYNEVFANSDKVGSKIYFRHRNMCGMTAAITGTLTKHNNKNVSY